MNKVFLGILLGLILGAIDGAAAWFYPEARSMLGTIMMGSSLKGMLVGLFTGWFAYKVQSIKWGIVVGSVLGLLFAFIVAAMDSLNGEHPYLQIMLPGFVVGAIVGFVTQRSGSSAQAVSRDSAASRPRS